MFAYPEKDTFWRKLNEPFVTKMINYTQIIRFLYLIQVLSISTDRVVFSTFNNPIPISKRQHNINFNWIYWRWRRVSECINSNYAIRNTKPYSLQFKFDTIQDWLYIFISEIYIFILQDNVQHQGIYILLLVCCEDISNQGCEAYT